MCLQRRHKIKERKLITDGIDRKGMKVYKVVAESVKTKKWYPPYSIMNSPSRQRIDKKIYEEGVNEANVDSMISIPSWDKNPTYKSGFHFYKNKLDAKKSAQYLNRLHQGEVYSPTAKHKYKVVTCTVKKSWITAIGMEWGIKKGVYAFGDEEAKSIVIVAKKAIFGKNK